MEAAALQSKLKALGPGTVLESRRFGRSGDLSVWVETKTIAQVARTLRTDGDLALDWLENLSAMQLDEAFVLTYVARSTITGETLVVRASAVPESADADVEIPSVRAIWPMAAPMETEIAELFGMRFVDADGAAAIGPEDHSFIRLPAGLQGYPLRKNYVFPQDVGGILHGRPRMAGAAEPRADAIGESDLARGLE